MEKDVSILSLLSKILSDERQIKVLRLMSEDIYGEELLKKLLDFKEE